MKHGLFIIIFILCIKMTIADLAVYVKPIPKQAGTTLPYTFNFTTDASCADVVLSTSVNITTDSDGIGYANINMAGLTHTPKYICEYKSGILRTMHTINSGYFNEMKIVNNLTASWVFGNINASYIQNAPWITAAGGDTNCSVSGSCPLIVYASNTTLWDILTSDDVINTTNFGGDVSGTVASLIVIDNSHLHHWENISNKPVNLDIDGTDDITTAGGTITGDLNVIGSVTIVGSLLNASVTNQYLNGSFLPDRNNLFDIGSLTMFWANMYATKMYAADWSNITITESQISDLAHTTDTNCSADNSCPLICYNSETSLWDKDGTNDVTINSANLVTLHWNNITSKFSDTLLNNTIKNLDTNCTADGSCPLITYDSETAAWDKISSDDVAISTLNDYWNWTAGKVDYHNISSIPQCTTEEKLIHDGTDFSCIADNYSADTDTDTVWDIKEEDFINNTNVLELNWTSINLTIDARSDFDTDTDIDTWWDISTSWYLGNYSNILDINTSRLNETILDLDTNCTADNSCPLITYDGETSAWDKDTTNDVTINSANLITSHWDNITNKFYDTLLNNTIRNLDTNCTAANSCPDIIYETELDDLSELNTQITDADLVDAAVISTTYLNTTGDVLLGILNFSWYPFIIHNSTQIANLNASYAGVCYDLTCTDCINSVEILESGFNNKITSSGENITAGTINFARLPALDSTHLHNALNLTNTVALANTHTHTLSNITINKGIEMNNYNISGVSNITFSQDATHKMYSNSTCVIIVGDTSTLYIC